MKKSVLFAGLLLNTAVMAGCSTDEKSAEAEQEHQAQIEQLENKIVELEKENKELQNENQQLLSEQSTFEEPETEQTQIDSEVLEEAKQLGDEFLNNIATADIETLAGQVSSNITVSGEALIIDSGNSVTEYTFDYYQGEQAGEQAAFMDSFPHEDTLFLIYDVSPTHGKIYIQFAENEIGELKVMDIYNEA